MIKIKRIYDPPAASDGLRVLVDRLWPRGLSKEKAKINLWLKDVAPSDSLRKWFSHDPAKWPEFKKRYGKELSAKKDALEIIGQLAKEKKTVTLLYAAKDEKHNNAVVLAQALQN